MCNISKMGKDNQTVQFLKFLVFHDKAFHKIMGYSFLPLAGLGIGIWTAFDPSNFVATGAIDPASKYKIRVLLSEILSLLSLIALLVLTMFSRKRHLVILNPKEVKLEIFIFYNSKINRLPMTLHPDWSWDIIFNIFLSAFRENPTKKDAIFYPKDKGSYKLIDLNSEKWINHPSIAKQLSTDKIVIIHSSELSKIENYDDETKQKYISKVVKELCKIQ